MRLRTLLATATAGLLGQGLSIALSQDADPYAAEYDKGQSVRIDGEVKQLQWTNPRAWMVVIVDSVDGAASIEYAVMLPSAALLQRRGWTSATFAPGDHVSIDGFAARDGEPRALAQHVIAADGETLLDLEAEPVSYSRNGADVLQSIRPE